MGPEDVAAKEQMAAKVSETRKRMSRDLGAAPVQPMRRDPALRRMEAMVHEANARATSAIEQARKDRAKKNRATALAIERRDAAVADAENAGERLRCEQHANAELSQKAEVLQKSVDASARTIEGLKWQVSKLPTHSELRRAERKLTASEAQNAAKEREAAALREEAQRTEAAAERERLARQAADTATREANAKLKAQGQKLGGLKSRRGDEVRTPASLLQGKHRARTAAAADGDEAPTLEAFNHEKNALQALRAKVRSGGFSPQVLASWLGKDNIRQILNSSKQGCAVKLEQASELKDKLASVWDKELAIMLKFDSSLSDEQMDSLRKAFAFEWDENEHHFVKRAWVQDPFSKRIVTFPEPLVSRYAWKPDFLELCAKHNIESHANGMVAERGAEPSLILLLQRCMHLADKNVGLTADNAVLVSAQWDAVSWQHRKVTHGGFKFASFDKDMSHQSELNFITCGISKTDDGFEGQKLFLARFAPGFNELKSRAVVTVPGFGVRHVKLTMCTDLSFTRSAAGRRAGSASHCKCDADTDARRKALHEPPDSKGHEGYDEINRKFFSRCTLLTHPMMLMLSHLVAPDHDWKKGFHCDACNKTIFKTKEEYDQFYTKLSDLEERALNDKDARKALDKTLADHAANHFKQYLGRGGKLGVDMLQWYLDIMHGQDLNIAKVFFKYSFLDGIMDDQRPEMAAVLVEAGVPFDIRKKAKEGGERDAKEKWLKASKVNIFFDGRSRDELPEGGALPGTVMKLLDCRYLDAEAKPLPLPTAHDQEEPAPPTTTATTSKPATTFQRPSKKQKPVPRAVPPPSSVRAADPVDPSSFRSLDHVAYKGMEPDLVTALISRFHHWSPKCAWVIRGWQAQSEMRSILKEPWPSRPSLEVRKERATRFFHAAVEAWRALEAISNSRHKSWYMHSWCFVLPRQIVECGDLWQHATCAIEFRGARITRQKVSWRPQQKEANERRIKRGDVICKFQQKYNSDPMTQLLRNISAIEELKSGIGAAGIGAAKGTKANRLRATGRTCTTKLEPKVGYQATDFSQFLREMNQAAGADT